jgi:hypothetical protein
MSINGSQEVGFDFTSLNVTTTTQTGTSGTSEDAFAEQFMQVKADMLSVLVGSAMDNGSSTAGSSSQNSTTDPFAGATGLSANGYNTSLYDPQSAYNMMTTINNDEVDFKAQYADLSQMGTAVQGMQQDGTALGAITTSTGTSDIEKQLQQFVTEYNAWIKQFSGDMQQGGVLSGTQAATESVYELQQNITSIFNGAGSGVQGMGDLGLTIDPKTGMASLDTSKLESVLASNKTGAVAAIDQFSGNFAKSAQLLNESDNFIPSQLNNLNNAISFITTNLSSLQSEFGMGDPANPTPAVSQALAAYNSMMKT